MKEKKGLLYVISVICTIIAVAAIVYAFREEIRAFFESICARCVALKEKIASKFCCEYECDEDADEDTEIDITAQTESDEASEEEAEDAE